MSSGGNVGGTALSEFGTSPIQLDFYLESHFGPRWQIGSFLHRCGWLMACRCTLDTLVSFHESVIVAACNEEGEPYSHAIAERLLGLTCSLPTECHFDPPPELEWQADALYWDFLGTCDLENLVLLEALEADTESTLDALRLRANGVLGEADRYVAALRRERRDPSCAMDRRQWIDGQIGLVNAKITESVNWLRQRSRQIRQAATQREADILESLSIHGEMEPLYVVHWRTRTGRRPREIAFPLQQEEKPNSGIDGNSELAQRADVAMREAQHLKRGRIAKHECRTNPVRKPELQTMARNDGSSSDFADPKTGRHQRLKEAVRIYRKGHEAAARQRGLSSEDIRRCEVIWRERRRKDAED